ncbi:MAG: DUF6580 family putative transport protein [Pseudomonadota bacterium]|nr:DUF6580 family putative transport protein [Pseudomonadota bacterium]
MLAEHRLNPTATLVAIGLLVAFGVIGRLLPHWPNFTPLVALAVFAAFLFRTGPAAWIIPAAVLLISNLILGFYEPGVMAGVFAGALLAVTAGRIAFRHGATVFSIGAASLGGALTFFVLSNLAVWTFGADGHAYPHTLEGLVACFTAALPFFKYMLAGTVFWGAVLFGGYALAMRLLPGAFTAQQTR